MIQRDNSGNNKIIEYGALLCEGANGDPCEVASITDSEIVIKSRVMTEFLIEVADTESAKSSQFIELDES